MRCIDADAYIKYINTALNDALNGATAPSGIISCLAIVKAIEDDLRNEKITPTIEPERKTGKWVELGENPDGTHNICCGYCGVGKYKSKGHANSEYTKQRFKFCPYCGAKMEEGGQE